MSNQNGSPGGKTGSVGDGQTCISCHSGAWNSGSGTASVTSNIPVSGYVPGNTYTVTMTAVDNQAVPFDKFGFEVTSEDASGSKQ